MDMTLTSPSPKRQRRPQAERSAGTRAKLIEATVSCLHRFGYSGTTVSLVASEAGVSRGAMTHQFPTKVDMMLALVRAEFDEDVAFYEASFAERDLREALADLPVTLWGRLNRPAAIAVTEIMLASRSDQELASRLRTMQSEIDQMARAGIAARMLRAGVAPRPDESAIHRLIVAAVRGLSIEALFMSGVSELEASVAVLRTMLGMLHPALAAPPSEGCTDV